MIKNVLNIDEIETFLHGLASDSSDDRLSCYLVSGLKKAVIKEESFFETVEEYPKNPPKWLTPEKYRNDTLVRFNPDLAKSHEDKFRHVRDWIEGALNNNDEWVNNLNSSGIPKKIASISTLDNASARANKAMKQKAAILRSQFDKASTGFTDQEAAGDIKTVRTFESGRRIVKLLTPKALDYETAKLGHCIGNDGYDERLKNADRFQYYSLRSPLNTPHATIEVQDGILKQCKGKQNEPPVENYSGNIIDFIRENKWPIHEDVAHTGLFYKDKTYYEARNLPTGFSWDDTLSLEGVKWLTSLPDDLLLRKNLYLRDCIGLTSIGNNLLVGGDLGIEGCTNIVSIGDNISVDGDCGMYDCTSLVSVGDNMTVGGTLDMEGNVNLISIGDNFSVGENLDLSGCVGLVSIGDNLTVEGHIVWNNSNFQSVEDFRQAFEEMHAPINNLTDNSLVKSTIHYNTPDP